MNTITLTKNEYERLAQKALCYDYLHELMKGDFFASPPVKNGKKIIEEFSKTGFYNDKFLASLEKGLKRSSYFKNEDTSLASRTQKISQRKKSHE